jgi:glycosyltransferase involved in cell wall biosynthesis
LSLISVVIPLYNEEGNVPELMRRISEVCERIRRGGDDYEIVAVNDGSQDGTLAALRAELRGQPRLVIIDLSRNFGHQIAATAGIENARGDAVILMDGDLQDPPELLEAFLAKWREGYDVVFATRRARKGESFFKKTSAQLFYRLIRRLTNVSIPVDTGDFRLMSRRVVDALAQSPEKRRFLRGLVAWVGFRQVGIEYDRDPRFTGETKYPFSKMLRFAIDGITSFSEIPLRFATYLGFIVSGGAFVYAIVVALLFLGGVQLISLGIAGEYLGRIYDQVKARPLYLVSSVERAALPPATVAREPIST